MFTFQDTAISRLKPVPPSILVMEDEMSVARGLEIVLSEEGYAVDLATTGHDALDRCAQKEFDLLVADLRLPDINGLDVIRQVKARRPGTGVVVITGYASVSSAVDAMKLGTFDYLPKPFTEDEIKTAVDGALKGQKSAPAETVIQKVEKSAEDKLIQKREVAAVLDRTRSDDGFWKALIERGSEALEGYRLTAEAKAAIASGDLQWLRGHIETLSEEQLRFIYSRLEREAW
jgi:DNA-binding response OmpR family regulator